MRRLAAAALLTAAIAGCGGGGGAVIPPAPDPAATDFSLQLDSPYADGQIFDAPSVVVSGKTAPDAEVTVNGQATSVNGSGSFSRALPVSGKTLFISVSAVREGKTLTVIRTAYYRDPDRCVAVRVKEDPATGVEKVFDEDPDIPGSARRISAPTPLKRAAWPALSPDNVSVAFVSIRVSDGESGVVVAPCDGSGVETARVGPDGQGALYRSPAWSPDGARLAWSADAGAQGNYDVYYESGALVLQVDADPADDDAPDWSPDGATLVFHSDRNPDGGAADRRRIWTVALSGGAPQALPGPIACGGSLCHSSRPRWSSGNAIVFQYEDACPAPPPSGPPSCTGNSSDLWMLNPAGAASPQALTSGGNQYVMPKWDGAGNALLFTDAADGGAALKTLTVFPSAGTVQDLDLQGSQGDW